MITNDLPLTLSMQLLSSLKPHETLNFRIMFSKHNDNLAKTLLLTKNWPFNGALMLGNDQKREIGFNG